MGDMYQQYLWIINRVACIAGMRLRRIVFQVNHGQTKLIFVQYFVTVLKVVFGCLADHKVKVKLAHQFGWNFTHIVRHIEGRPLAAISFGMSGLDGQVPVMLDASKGIQIAAVNMPDEDIETFHTTAPFASTSPATLRTLSGDTFRKQRWSMGQSQ